MDIPKEIYERLQKLLRKAESAKAMGSLAEAEAFANKATELLMEYNLSRENIDLEDKPKVIRDWIKDKNFLPKNEGRWLILLYFTICKHNLCRGITQDDGHEGFSIVGEKVNVEIVRYICDQLEVRLRGMAKAAYKTYYGSEKKNAFVRGFLLGAIQGIDVKLSQHLREMVVSNANITALVVVKNKAIAEFVDQEFGTLRSGRGARYSAQDGKAQGFEAGKNIDIHKGVGKGAIDRNLLN